MKAVNKGFTLIELMIVVAVIGVLAAIAIPQYQNYVAKAELGSALSTLASLKTNVEDQLAKDGVFPTATEDDVATVLGAPEPTNGKITADPVAGKVGEGSITFTFNSSGNSEKINGAIVTLTRAAGTSAWSCGITAGKGGTELTNAIMPKGCTLGTTPE
ncbi:prepilin-type cleavage/methylation domain-containing protein [Plesiomonas shigelloides]|uniref:pilin n=1 Tax=Plesiomonas shigelloides TaxID=703 RepID=UPI000D5691FB|nr:pilin [Plesiomonas shigelloides]PVU67271.1 prepilin-type cleavage/methylation domain-containing protein [Plesiomonas shigelloides]